MFPTIEIFGVTFYTFGTLMACTWFLFFILLHRASWKHGIHKPVFAAIVPFTLSMFFFGRFFYILAEWVEQKFILMELVHGNIVSFLRLFFIPQDYFFSLFGAVFGFFLVFFILTEDHKKDRRKYLDAIMEAFLWAGLLGYFAALLWGQIYGVSWNSPFSLIYDHKNSIVNYRTPLFPLAIVYILSLVGIIFSIKKLSHLDLPHGYRGYVTLAVFSAVIFILEFLSGSRKDIFYDYFSLSLSQIGAVIGIIVSILGILRISNSRL